MFSLSTASAPFLSVSSFLLLDASFLSHCLKSPLSLSPKRAEVLKERDSMNQRERHRRRDLQYLVQVIGHAMY